MIDVTQEPFNPSSIPVHTGQTHRFLFDSASLSFNPRAYGADVEGTRELQVNALQSPFVRGRPVPRGQGSLQSPSSIPPAIRFDAGWL